MFFAKLNFQLVLQHISTHMKHVQLIRSEYRKQLWQNYGRQCPIFLKKHSLILGE